MFPVLVASGEAAFYRSVSRYMERLSRLRGLLRFLVRDNAARGRDFGITAGNLCRLFTCYYLGLVVGGECFRW